MDLEQERLETIRKMPDAHSNAIQVGLHKRICQSISLAANNTQHYEGKPAQRNSKVSGCKDAKRGESLPLGHPIAESLGHFKFKITNPAARRSIWDLIRIFSQHIYDHGILKMVDFPRCEKDETVVRYMPYHWTEQRDICEGHRSPDDGLIESNQDHEAHFGPSEIHGGGGVDPIPCVSMHRISDSRSGPAQLIPPHVKQRSHPHGVRPQIPDR